jgi:hypothetical protein
MKNDERLIASIIGGALLMIIIITLIALLSCGCTKDNLLPDNKVKDIDGNEYTIEQFGDQIWFTEDLKTTRYNDGSLIHEIKDTVPNYTFYMIDKNNICPLNWHVPKDWEWAVLSDYFESNNLSVMIGFASRWWSSSTLVEGYESPQAWAWYQGGYAGELHNQVVLKEQYLNIRCIKN